jgi:hypothetical protein
VNQRRARRADGGYGAAPGLVLAAGALRALEGRPIRLLLDLRRANQLGLPVRIPAGCLSQAWRGGPRSASIARLLKQACAVVPLDERAAREVGEFIATVRFARPEKPDIVDAHVALVTRATMSLVCTSDPDDMKRYGVGADFIRTV